MNSTGRCARAIRGTIRPKDDGNPQEQASRAWSEKHNGGGKDMLVQDMNNRIASILLAVTVLTDVSSGIAMAQRAGAKRQPAAPVAAPSVPSGLIAPGASLVQIRSTRSR
jgi:hypothetical protein